MSVNRDCMFAAIPYDAEKVRKALNRIADEVVGEGALADLSCRAKISADINKHFGRATFRTTSTKSMELLNSIAGYDQQAIFVDFCLSAKGGTTRVVFRWQSEFSCELRTEDERSLQTAVNIIVEEFNLTGVADKNTVASRLAELDERLSRRYRQACDDISDTGRLSYNGSVYDLRDVLAGVLRILAPDEAIADQPWFRKVSDATGPSQAQRGRYILEVVRNRGKACLGSQFKWNRRG